MKTLAKILGTLGLVATSIILILISVQGFIGMFESYGWPAVKFFGAGFLALIAACGAGELGTSLFKELVNQDKWHNSLLYKLGIAISTRSQQKVVGAVEYILENWN